MMYRDGKNIWGQNNIIYFVLFLTTEFNTFLFLKTTEFISFLIFNELLMVYVKQTGRKIKNIQTRIEIY